MQGAGGSARRRGLGRRTLSWLLLLGLATGPLAFRPCLPARPASPTSTGLLRTRPLPRTPNAARFSSPKPTSTTGPLHAWPTGRDPKSFARDFPVTAARVGITVLGTVLTYIAHTNQRCSPVLASASVTLAGSLIAPGLGQVCGYGLRKDTVVDLPNTLLNRPKR